MNEPLTEETKVAMLLKALVGLRRAAIQRDATIATTTEEGQLGYALSAYKGALDAADEVILKAQS